ncbi:hypothetical protein ADUPG1_005518, partial [Aduncisulcus paluster]
NKQKQSPIGKNVGVGANLSLGLGFFGASGGLKITRLANGNLAVLGETGGGADTGIGINGKFSAHSSDSRGSAGLGGQSLEYSTTIDPKVAPFTVGMSKSYSKGANATDYEFSPSRLGISVKDLTQPITNSAGVTNTHVFGEYDVIPDAVNDMFDYFLSQNRTKYQTGKKKTK